MDDVSTPWLNAKAAAVYCGRKTRYAYKWIQRKAREGKIRAGHNGREPLFRIEDLDDMLMRNGKKAAER